MSGFDPFSILAGVAGGGKPLNSDAGNYAPVSSAGTTGDFYMGEGSGKAAEIPLELIAIAGLFLWLMLSKR